MISKNQIERLMKNWGDRANALACKAEVRIYHPESNWQCYLLAANPDDIDEVICVISNYYTEIKTESLKEMFEFFEFNGSSLEIDNDFWPLSATELLKRLK